MSSASQPVSTPSASRRSVALDATRIIALGLIFWVHAVEGSFGGFRAFNPSEPWGSLSDRWAEWRPLPGIAGLMTSVARWVGSLGDMAVGVFIMVSGIALTMSALKRGGIGNSIAWIRRHLWALIPGWVLVHFGVAVLAWVKGDLRYSLANWEFWASLVGVRFLPSTMYFGLAAWWYVGMLVQFYLMFPLLLGLLQRVGVKRFLTLGLVSTLIVRALGLLLIHGGWLDSWSRGGFAISRLPEFIVGMAIGHAVLTSGEPLDQWIRERTPLPIVLSALVALAMGWLASFTLLGMTVAPLVATLGLGILLLSLGARLGGGPWWTRLSDRSYEFFIVHHLPVMALCTPAPLLSAGILARYVAALVASLVGAEVVHRMSNWIRSREGWFSRPRTKAWLAGALALFLAALCSSEAASQKAAPAENLGWGERPSLVPDRRWGWKQEPNSTHRLRWLGYDYTVKADGDGLPVVPSAAGGRSVLVLGDAFSSANGVDYDKNWVSLLPAASMGTLRVAKNASVTGWGPDQEARAAEDLIPATKPDVVVVESFGNDLLDVMLTDDDFRKQAGFANPDPSRFPGLMAGSNLRHQLLAPAVEGLKAALGKTGDDTAGYAFLDLMSKDEDPALDDAANQAQARFKRIKAAADAVGAKVVVAIVPSSIQVCRAADLPYMTSSYDPANYDLDRPQRMLTKAWKEAGVTDVLDLRQPLSTGTCPYVPYNMHWTEEGHQRVAAAVAKRLG